MHTILEEDFSKGNVKRLNEMEELRKQQDKHILFCRRIIVKEQNQKNPILEWELLTFLMHIQHKYYYLYKYAFENRYRQDKEIDKLLLTLKDYFEKYYEAYFQKDIKKIHQINKLREEYYFGKCFTLIEKSSGKKAVILSQIAEIFRLIQVGTSPMLGQFLDISHYY